MRGMRPEGHGAEGRGEDSYTDAGEGGMAPWSVAEQQQRGTAVQLHRPRQRRRVADVPVVLRQALGVHQRAADP